MRPNEKPLETGGKSTNDAPFGELISGNEKLKDDLSSIKAPPPKKKEEIPSRVPTIIITKIIVTAVRMGNLV